LDRYLTVMIIPGREKGIKSIRIPNFFFRAFVFLFVLFFILLGILGYDYWKIILQVYENKHLRTENRLLKEQIKLNQMKINTLTEDIKRIHTFEEKLKIITGLKNIDKSKSFLDYRSPDSTPSDNHEEHSEKNQDHDKKINTILQGLSGPSDNTKQAEYNKLKNLYELKIAETFGQQTGYKITKAWSKLASKTFALSHEFASFDYQFQQLKEVISDLEVDIHQIDQYLLDQDSFVKSTPTLLPARGWITSYYGHRASPYSGRVKMHEGLDIGGDIGTPIIAPADGIVTYSGEKPGFGILVQLDHGYGLETIFAHAKSSKVKLGEKVKRGTTIAQVGNTGISTGPHLHYEIRVNGTPVDPLYYILD